MIQTRALVFVFVFTLSGVAHATETTDDVVEALIRVESSGDPCARRGRHVGALQMAPNAAADIGIELESLHCDREAAIRAFWAYQHRYAHLTGLEAHAMVVLWKIGPGAFASGNWAGAAAYLERFYSFYVVGC